MEEVEDISISSI